MRQLVDKLGTVLLEEAERTSDARPSTPDNTITFKRCMTKKVGRERGTQHVVIFFCFVFAHIDVLSISDGRVSLSLFAAASISTHGGRAVLTLSSLGVEEKLVVRNCIRLLVSACVSDDAALNHFMSMPSLDSWLENLLLKVSKNKER